MWVYIHVIVIVVSRGRHGGSGSGKSVLGGSSFIQGDLKLRNDALLDGILLSQLGEDGLGVGQFLKAMETVNG